MEAMKPTMEQELERMGALMMRNAERLTIQTNEDFERGNTLLKDIKGKIKAVKDYWKEPKAAAQAAHKQLVARESAMLKPLESAENTIKRMMLDYTKAQEKAAREAEEAARREREAEAHRLEAIAAQAEAEGDVDTAEIMHDMAEAVPVAEVVQTAPKAQGVSVRKVWKARVMDEKLVPAYFDGYKLRDINMTTLNSLARWKEGQLEIPGVEFYQESTMSVRT